MPKKVYVQSVETRPEKTPQSKPLPGRKEEMEQNFGGGWSFVLTPIQTVTRFLILGSAEGTYYANPTQLTEHNMGMVEKAIAADPKGVLDLVLDVNLNNRARSVDQSLLLYSMLLNNPTVGVEAATHFNEMVRIGTHLFSMAELLSAQSKFNKRAAKLFAGWYAAKNSDQLARQLSKYQQREGWSHRDVLRLSHLNPTNMPVESQAALRWAVARDNMGEYTITRKNNDKPEVRPDLTGHLPVVIQGFEKAKTATSSEEVMNLIKGYGLEREHIPTQWLNEKNVWDALSHNLRVMALLRNLNKMTQIGAFENREVLDDVISKITNAEKLKGERVHPLTVLLTLKVYESGKGIGGDLTWTPNREIVEALNKAFYLAFGAVTPVNKPILFSMDVSSSMTGARLFTFRKKRPDESDDSYGGAPKGYKIATMPIVAAEAQAAIALVMARTEPNIRFGVYETKYHEIGFDKNMSLNQAMRYIMDRSFGGTDCALPFLWAASAARDREAFISTTDGETWAGHIHPSEAFKQYCAVTGVKARSVIAAMTSTKFSLSDPKNPDMLDVVGFDSQMFNTISSFLSGEL